MGKASWKSTIKKKTLDPEWHETCQLVVFKVVDEMLLLEVRWLLRRMRWPLVRCTWATNGCRAVQMFDHDDVGSDDFMGRVRISMMDLVEHGRINNKTYPLEDVKKGEVTLSVRFREL